MTTATFNRNCRVLAFVALVGGIALSAAVRPSFQDFTQFYVAGAMARAGLWSHLYPTPLPASTHHPGTPEDSTVSDEFRATAERYGMYGGVRFIQPPPAALLYTPLAYLPPRTAYQLWLVTMALFGWAIACQAGRVYAAVTGRDTRAAGWIVLFVACSPLMYRAVRVANVSPLVGWAFGVGLLDLMRRAPAPGSTRNPVDPPQPAEPACGALFPGVALFLGALMKYLPAILLPLYAVRGRWRPPACAAALAILTLAATLAVTGRGPFDTFLHDIAPTLSRPYENHRNQSLQGFLLRLTGTPRLPPSAAAALGVLQWATLALILAAIVKRRRAVREPAPSVVCAAATALLGWALLFSPIFWEHYVVYLCPLWGWLISQAGRSRARLTAVAAAIATVYFPLQALTRQFPEPLNSHVMIGVAVTWAIGLSRLFCRAKPQAAPSETVSCAPPPRT